jgi:hypothetical protein
MEDIYTNKLQKYITFVSDIINNWEFIGRPHTNKSDYGWRKIFKENKLKIEKNNILKKYTYLFLFFLLKIIPLSFCQNLELTQSYGSFGGNTYRSEYINFGEITNYHVFTDSDTNYSLRRVYAGNPVFSFTAYNETNREYGVRIIEYSPILTFSVTKWFRFTDRGFSNIDTYNYDLSNLPSYTPCIVGHVVGQFVDSDDKIISQEVPVKWGPAFRRFKWGGDFNNIQGKYLDFVTIRNVVRARAYYGGKEHYVSKTATFRNVKLISQKIKIDPTYYFSGIKNDGTYGLISFDPNQHVLVGDKKPIILYPGTVLKAVEEDYFKSPSSPISQLSISNKQKVMDEIVLYPNPNDGKLLYIKKNKNELVHKIEIYDGVKIVYTWLDKINNSINKKNNDEYITIDLSLKKGVYNCRVHTNTGIYNRKLFIQ